MLFNHRKISANRVESLKPHGSDAIFETPLKVVALAHLPVTSNTLVGSVDDVNNCVIDLFRGQRQTKFYNPQEFSDPTSNKKRFHELKSILNKLLTLNQRFVISGKD